MLTTLLNVPVADIIRSWEQRGLHENHVVSEIRDPEMSFTASIFFINTTLYTLKFI